MDQPKVLILDSGAGGLTVASDIRRRLPFCHLSYIADLSAFPYGTKSGQTIIDRTTQVVRHAIPKYRPDVIVIACNTASTIALERLRQQFDLPFVGVVPAIKPAAALTQSGAIGVLATQGTVNGSYTNSLIEEYARNRAVFLHGSANLVHLAEQKMRNASVSTESIHNEVEALFASAAPHQIDIIVLACTHFPLLRQELVQAYPDVKHWVDSGEAIARRVDHWVTQLQLQRTDARSTRANQFITTATTGIPYAGNMIQHYLGNFSTDKLIFDE